MKLHSIQVENILGCASASLTMSTSPLALIAAGNAQGKSSFREAIALLFLGVSERSPNKKDWQKLVTDGAVSGTVSIKLADGNAGRLSLPSGRGGPFLQLDDLHKYAAGLCLGNASFAREPDKVRRKFAGALFGTSDTHEAVAAALIERGQPADMVQQIKPLLRAGTDAAKEDAAKRATEGKGAWKAITAEQWGSKKAAEWRPAGEPGDKPKRSKADAEIEERQLQSRIDGLNQQIGAASRKPPQAEIDQLRERAGKFQELLDARTVTVNLADELKSEISEAEAQLKALHVEPLSCPHCTNHVRLIDGVLQAAAEVDPAQVNALSAKVVKLRGELAELRATYSQQDAEVTAASTAKARLKAIEDAPEVDALALEALVNQHRARLEEIAAEKAHIVSFTAWHQRSFDANRWHQDITAWLALAEALADPTLGTAAGENPVQAFGNAVTEVCSALGWPAVQMGEGGEIYFGGRPAQFVSESDRWKVDTATSIVVARTMDLGFVMLDRCDVIEPAARAPLFQYLAESSGLETVLAFATLKSPPKMPDAVAVLWLGGGVGSTVVQTQQVAA